MLCGIERLIPNNTVTIKGVHFIKVDGGEFMDGSCITFFYSYLKRKNIIPAGGLVGVALNIYTTDQYHLMKIVSKISKDYTGVYLAFPFKLHIKTDSKISIDYHVDFIGSIINALDPYEFSYREAWLEWFNQ